MSFTSREKKRLYRQKTRSIKKAQRGHPDRWYLTITTRTACCNNPRCGGILRKGSVHVYRHSPRELLCPTCAKLRKIAARPSRTYEKHVLEPQRQRRAAKSEQARERGRYPRSTANDAWGRELLDRVREI